MNLSGAVVCVNFANLLRKSLERWDHGLDRLVVITSSKDADTQRLCEELLVETHVTDIFYENGARFNKGAALSEAFLQKGLRDDGGWLMTFDADIVPPRDWRERLERETLVPGNLYGSWRYQIAEDETDLDDVPEKRMPQGWVIGFFMLFHSQDPCLPSGPIFDLCWPHAGNYDTLFCRKWPKSRQKIFDLKMLHFGEERAKWWGPGKEEEFKTQVLGRRRKSEDWERERMKNPPAIRVGEKVDAL